MTVKGAAIERTSRIPHNHLRCLRGSSLDSSQIISVQILAYTLQRANNPYSSHFAAVFFVLALDFLAAAAFEVFAASVFFAPLAVFLPVDAVFLPVAAPVDFLVSAALFLGAAFFGSGFLVSAFFLSSVLGLGAPFVGSFLDPASF